MSIFQSSKPILMSNDQLAELLTRYLPTICNSENWLRHNITIQIVAKKDDLTKKTIQVSEMTMSAVSSLAADPEEIRK